MNHDRRSPFHTVLADGTRPDIVKKEEERHTIEQHFGRFIITWGFLDFTLSMALAALSNPRLHSNFQEMYTHSKIEFLRSVLPSEWADGQQLLTLLNNGNKYRNRLAHPLLAMSGHSGGRDWGWHLWRPNRENGTLDLRDERKMLAQESDAKIATVAVEALLHDDFRSAVTEGDVGRLSLRDTIIAQPGQWETQMDYDRFINRVEGLFGPRSP